MTHSKCNVCYNMDKPGKRVKQKQLDTGRRTVCDSISRGRSVGAGPGVRGEGRGDCYEYRFLS